MLASEQTNSSPVKKNSPFMETVQDKLKDIKNFSNWSAKEQMIAVGAVGVMVGALLPFVAVALPVAATGAIVALTLFFAVKAVEYTFKGLKWSAEKTVDGAKYTAEKVKDASIYTAEKAREGYHSVKGAISSVGRATREGTGAALGKMGNGVQKLGRKMSNSGASMSNLENIPYSIEQQEPQGVVLSAKRELDPDLISSNRDLKRDSLQSSSLSRSNSVSSLDSVRTDSTISSEAELLNPAKHKEVKTATSLWDKVSSPFKSGKKSEKTSEVEYQALESGAMPPATVNPNRLRRSSSSSSLTSELTPVASPKVPGSPSIDSGMGSGSSTPKGQSLLIEKSSRRLDEAMKELDLAVSQLPSTKVGENSVHHPAGVKVKMD